MTTTEKSPTVQPYLFFDGRCEEALEFYKNALGAQVLMLVRYKENPDSSHNPPGAENKIMHARLTVGGSVIFASDGHCAGKPQFEGFSLSITVDSEAGADRYFNALADGGQVRMPLEKTFFSPRFGMVTDRFGVLWMVLATPNQAS
jgi:PhnB protein